MPSPLGGLRCLTSPRQVFDLGYCVSSFQDFGGGVATKNLLLLRDTDNGPAMFEKTQCYVRTGSL